MRDMLHNLPTDIINIIFGKMSYNPQPKELMEDIRNFGEINKFLTEMYENQFRDGDSEGTHAPIEWLENDLWAWANNYQALTDGFDAKIYLLWENMSRFWVDDMKTPNYDVFGQMPPPPTRRPLSYYKIDCYLTNYLEHKPLESQVRLFLGAMKPAQRVEFVEITCNQWKNIVN